MRQRGFTLLEVLMTLLLLGIITAVAVTSVTSSYNDSAFDATVDEMAKIREALVGDPNLKNGNTRTSFGYFGDVGALPAALGDLITKPGAVTASTNDNAKRVIIGWNGPYLQSQDSGADFTRDEWGNAYVYTPAAGTPALVSLGADGAVGGTGLAQDITVQFPASTRIATVHGFLVDTGGAAANLAATINLYYPNGTGGIATATTNTVVGDNGHFSIANVPLGARAALITVGVTTYGPIIFTVDRATFTIPTKLTKVGPPPPSCPLSTIEFEDPTSTDSEANTSPAFTIITDEDCAYDMTVNYTLTALTASAGGDFALVNGTATILAGDTSVDIHVTVVNDAVDEADETFRLTISAPSPADVTIGATNQHTYTIDNDDAAVCVPKNVNYNSSTTFTVPGGCTHAIIRAWGGGGGAGSATTNRSGDGGGSGYAYTNSIVVTPGETFAFVIGAGGGNGKAGCAVGGGGTHAGGVGASLAAGTAGGGLGMGGGGGAAGAGGYAGGGGRYGGGGGGSANVASNGGGHGGGSTTVYRNGTAAYILIAGGGGGGGGAASTAAGDAGHGGPGCSQLGGAAAAAAKGGGGGGGACSGTNTANGAGRNPANTAQAGSKGRGAAPNSSCSTGTGKNGRVRVEYTF